MCSEQLLCHILNLLEVLSNGLYTLLETLRPEVGILSLSLTLSLSLSLWLCVSLSLTLSPILPLFKGRRGSTTKLASLTHTHTHTRHVYMYIHTHLTSALTQN